MVLRAAAAQLRAGERDRGVQGKAVCDDAQALEKGISRFRKRMKMPKEIDKYLSSLPIDENSKKSIFGYFLEQMLFADEMPTNKLILIEGTRDIRRGTRTT